jgi:hypothetical protein
MKKILLIGCALVMTGCLTTSPDKTAWNMAQEINTPAAYENFMLRYPESSYADDARELVEKAKIDQIRNANTVAECVRAIKTVKDRKIAENVADLAFKAALTETTAEALYDFLSFFKDHKGAPEIRKRLEEIEYRTAKEDSSPVPMEYFLLKYPDSTFAGEGRDILAEKSYRQVRSWNNHYGFKAFLLKFPDTPQAAEVRQILASSAPPQREISNAQPTLAVIGNSAWLKRYGCALSLSNGIANKSGDVDSLRRELHEMEKAGGSGAYPESCSSLKLALRPGVGGEFAEAVGVMVKTEERRKELANIWEVYRQREQVAKTAAETSVKVADDLEAAELSEDVLGSGPLGGLDAGKEKGSLSARKAHEYFTSAVKTIEKNRNDIKQVLQDVDGVFRPLRYYISTSVVAQ